MPFIDPWLAKGDTMSPLEYERTMFEQTRNPIHVWRTVQICRDLMAHPAGRALDAFPEWIETYLGTLADGIHELYDQKINDELEQALPAAIADLMGFKRAGQGKRADAFDQHELQRRDMYLAQDVDIRLRQEPNLTPREAASRIAEDRIEAKRVFDEHKRAGRIIAWATFGHPIVTEEVIYNAWKAWHDFHEDRRNGS